MGRMLEALKQPPSKRCPAPEEPSALRPFPPTPEPTAVEENEPEVPFIEVGGPTVQLSESVTGAAAPVAPPRPPAPIEQSVRLQPLPAPTPTPAAGQGKVSFQPVPFPGKTMALTPPENRFAAELLAYHQPEHPVSQQYRSLLANLTAQLPAVRIQVLLFTAPAPTIGTTTVLLNVAITAARQGQYRVAVVDANFQRPALAQRLGLPAVPGLREVLTGNVSLQRALQESGQLNLHALTAGHCRPGEEIRFPREAMRSILKQLRDRFELVLVDAPCWNTQPDLVALGAACDAVYLVLDAPPEEKPEAAHLFELIPQQGSQLRGCVLAQW